MAAPEHSSGRSGERVCVGVVVGPHGVRGQVRVKSFTARPEDVAAYGPVTDEQGERRFRLSVVGRSKGVVLCAVEGVSDRTAAEALKGVRLHVAREVLPEPEEEDEFYHADLVGLPVTFADGTPLGTITAVYDFGAGDVLEVKGEEGGVTMLPFTREAVPVVDVKGGRVVAERLPGLVEEPPKAPGRRRRRARNNRPGGAPRDAEPAAGDGAEADWPEEDWR